MYQKMSGFSKISPNFTSYIIGIDNGKNVEILVNDLLKLINNNIVSGLKGTAITTTNPDSPKNGDYYIAVGTGTFTNFKDSTNTAISVTTADNFAYLVYNGSYWTKIASTLNLTGYVQTSQIVDNLTSTSAVLPLSANQGRALAALIPAVTVTPGKNLYNSAAITNGYYISYTNGALLANSTSAVSDYIPVTVGQSYYISGRITSSGARGVTYYDSSKVIVNTPSGPTTWGDGALNGVYTIPAGVAYMRITVKFSGTGDPTVVQVEKGTAATAYEAYYESVTALASKQIVAYKVITENGAVYLPDYLTAKGYAAITQSTIPETRNIYNKATITTGFHINYANGALSALSTSSVSDYIPVKPSTAYYISGRVTSSGTRGVAYYDSSKTLINTPTGVSTWGDGPLNGVYTTTAATAYMRITTAFSGTGDPTVIQVEEGTAPTAFVAYSSYQAIATVNGTQVYPNPEKIIAYVKANLTTTKWTGKKICWMGTSIPANYPNADKATSYPNIAAQRVGATIINEALASSLMRIATSAGVALTTPYSQVTFGMTGAELTAAVGSTYAVNSYETKMLGHLDADLYVFDFGYNDFSVDNTNFAAIPSTVDNRNYFTGAFIYCINKLLAAKPKARFAIFGHYENQNRPLIAQAQQNVATYFSCPIWKTWEMTNWSTKVNPATSNTVLADWLPDGIHPGADTTGAATGLLANLAEGFLRTI
jgi:hypothetical protein